MQKEFQSAKYNQFLPPILDLSSNINSSDIQTSSTPSTPCLPEVSSLRNSWGHHRSWSTGITPVRDNVLLLTSNDTPNRDSAV